MKKRNLLKLIAIIGILLVLTGCGDKEETTKTSKKLFDTTKSMECVKTEQDEDGYTSTETVIVHYNSKKVLRIKGNNLMEVDPEYLEMTLSFGSAFTEVFKDIEGIDINYSKVNENSLKMTTEIDYTKLDLEKLKSALKAKLGELYDESENNGFYSNTEYTIDEFKETNLEGYSCK